jgi:SAM-dependent methyltransferase
LIFVNRQQVLDLAGQEKHYKFHQNDIRAEGYINFLLRLVNPLQERVSKGAKGLDFGSGPYPMLMELLNEKGYHNTFHYDPLYHPDVSVLTGTYDFILLCEVIEHMVDLRDDLQQIVNLLSQGGLFIISTGMNTSEVNFTTWNYIQDPTHINFFSPKTVEFLDQEFGLELLESSHNLLILGKR